MPPHPGRPTPLLLVASADPARRSGLRAALSRAGYAVEEASEGDAGVRAFRELEPDGVLLDGTPADGALEACRAMRREEARGKRPAGSTPILLLVGPEQLTALESARSAGATDFVELSMYEALLEHRVRTAMEACARLVEVTRAIEAAAAVTSVEELAERIVAAADRQDADHATGAAQGADSQHMARELAGAVERGELFIEYQPKLNVRSRQVVGMEALVRWRHPRLGLVRPNEFIPLAEETGLIVPIGEWVLRAACRQNKLWQDLGLQPIRMAVNLSQVQFQRPELCEVVAGVLEESELQPEWLELELTESMLMRDVHATIDSLRRLHSAGIHLSIDDFGTGYSSLSYLRRFPIDALKIDQSFVREVISDPDDAAIVTSIILMGHSLRLTVVAEGVETESQLSFLEVLQCDEVQGYLLSPPVPPEQAEAFLDGARR
jgi:EAL domain-containing protein (putative c-di-GMP-specific phosphodiesterase class I)/DNA-binding response OmpR family regulator